MVVNQHPGEGNKKRGLVFPEHLLCSGSILGMSSPLSLVPTPQQLCGIGPIIPVGGSESYSDFPRQQNKW